MADALEATIDILDTLVGFDSVSGRPTDGIVGYVQDYLGSHGIDCTLSFDEAGERANVFATIGPDVDDGVVLNGHTDVVPVEGQNWATDPFKLTRQGDRLFGRGSADMKGFLAATLAMARMIVEHAKEKAMEVVAASEDTEQEGEEQN